MHAFIHSFDPPRVFERSIDRRDDDDDDGWMDGCGRQTESMGARAETEEERPSSEADAGDGAEGKTKTAIEEAPTKTEVGTKRPRAEDADEDEAEAREVRGRPAETETRDGKEEKETTTTESGFGAPSSGGGGFGSALSGAGFGGFGGLKSGGGFGGFAAANANAGVGFASKASTPAFGGAAAAPVALFGAGKKEAEEEDGDDDPEREVANDSIKPIVELEVVETKTGEEDETCTFRTEGALFEYVVDKEKGSRWMERGRGDVRLNQGKNRYRLVMRAKGNFRLMLNASLFKGQKFQLMEGGKGVSFTCVNAASGDDAKMSMFALKMRAAASNVQSQAESFHAAACKAIEKLAKAEEK